jgi:hypothetical protein
MRGLRDLQRHLEWRLRMITNPWPEPPRRPEIYLAIAELLRRHEHATEQSVSLDLTPYELRVFSQGGEDGAIDEILRRIGPGTRTFVEFGAETGIEANCVYLADVACWRGTFIEGDDENFRSLSAKYAPNSRVTTTKAFVSAGNVEAVFERLEVPEDLDVLSIDVDGQDYWIWRAITRWRPRVVVIEYNGTLGDEPLVVPEGAAPWDQTSYFGASLRALRQLAAEKGYRFVYSDLCGSNAFFVRADLPDEFPPEDQVPVRAANYGLRGYRHRAGTGPYVRV